MSLILSGTDGLSDVDGTAATPAIRGTDANTGIFFPAADTIAFAEGGAECARFDSAGNFGLGTSSPAYKLDVSSTAPTIASSGSTYLGSSSTVGASFALRSENTTSWTGTRDLISFDSVGNGADHRTGTLSIKLKAASGASTLTEYLQLNPTFGYSVFPSGNLLVGTTSAFSGSGISPKVTVSNSAGIGLINIGNSDAGMVTQPAANTNYYAGFFLNSSSSGVGNIFCTGAATTFNTTSDYRLKNVVGNVTGQGERIDALKPIDYQWKEGGQQARGFLAHEFKTVYPNSVSGDKDATDADGKPVYQAMQASTSEVIADLVAEIQSLRKRLAALESA